MLLLNCVSISSNQDFFVFFRTFVGDFGECHVLPKPRPLDAVNAGGPRFDRQAEDLDSLIADSLSGVQAALDGDRKVPWSGWMG